MNSTRPDDLRASLRGQLEASGPAALAMLSGQAPLEPETLRRALQAAGLLDDVTVGDPALRALRRTLVHRARGSELARRGLEGLDLDPAGYALDPESLGEPEAFLLRLLGLAALVELDLPGVTALIEPALTQAEGVALMEPARAVPLASLAARLGDLLDLDEEHRAAALLLALEESALATPLALDRDALARGMAAAGALLQRSRLRAWIEQIASSARTLAERLEAEQPLVAAAAGHQGRRDAVPARVPLLDSPREELFLTSHAGVLYLEWAGDDALRPERVTLEPGAIELEPQAERFEDETLLWSMGWPPAAAVEAVLLHRAGGVARVRLADD